VAASRAVLSMIFSLAVLVVTSSFHAFQPRLPMNLCQPGDSLLLARATEIPSAIGTLLQCSPGRRLAGRTDKPAVESDGANTDSIFLCGNDLPRGCSSPDSKCESAVPPAMAQISICDQLQIDDMAGAPRRRAGSVLPSAATVAVPSGYQTNSRLQFDLVL